MKKQSPTFNKLSHVEAVAEPIPPQIYPKGFTGVARSMQCFENQTWRNFKIVTLHIKDGIVENIDYSDPFCNWEAIAKLEVANTISALNLNGAWVHGKTMSKWLNLF